MAKRIALTLLLLSAPSLLAACATTASTATTGNSPEVSKARCAGWRPLDFTVNGDPDAGETHGDTSATIQEIEEHNQTGKNKHCRMFFK